jgi:hypothetical protein
MAKERIEKTMETEKEPIKPSIDGCPKCDSPTWTKHRNKEGFHSAREKLVCTSCGWYGDYHDVEGD